MGLRQVISELHKKKNKKIKKEELKKTKKKKKKILRKGSERNMNEKETYKNGKWV